MKLIEIGPSIQSRRWFAAVIVVAGVIASGSGVLAQGSADRTARAIDQAQRAVRERIVSQDNARMLRVVDSQANFVLLNTGDPVDDMVAHFRKNGVLVAGPFPSFGKHIRVSMGSPEEIREFWRVFDLLPPSHVMTM